MTAAAGEQPIVLLSGKGGVGKTTLAAAAALRLAEEGSAAVQEGLDAL